MIYEKDELIRALRSNIQNLINLREKEQEEIEQLVQNNSELSEKLNYKEKECTELEIKLNTLKVAKKLSGKEDDPLAAKNKVSSLVREIDKCIALLNK